MGKLIYLFIMTLGIISCSSGNETGIEKLELLGKWKWTNTDGGISYHIHETPYSTGKTIELNIINNNRYSIKENNIEISKGSYEIIMKESIYSGEMELYITCLPENQIENQNIVLSGIITILENENLSIADNHEDGVESNYIKIK